jgi:deoxyribose-phosphate aldolase
MTGNETHSPPVDSVGIAELAARLGTRSLKGPAKAAALRLALGMIDLTTLEGKDTEGRMREVCMKARHFAMDFPGLPAAAAVCVYPVHVALARKLLSGSGVKVAAVSTGFPAGKQSGDVKMADLCFALAEGADEIDMVISRGTFLMGNYQEVYEEIANAKAACKGVTLKVILETGELGDLDKVRKASDLAIAAGADFIKTSTGKVQPAATPGVTLVMMQAVRDHFLSTGHRVGIKPAGGISSAKQALQYLIMLYETLGEEWLNSRLFRFGASGLASDILLQLGRIKSGTYYSRDYINTE